MSQVETRKTPGFGATFASEWMKLMSTRAPRRNLILGALLGIAMSTLITVSTRATIGDWPEDQQATFDPVLFPLSGTILVIIFFIAFGVNAVAPEYNSGMIRQTFATTPHRGRVLAAKMLAVYIAVGIAGAIVALIMHVISYVVLSPTDLPQADWASWELWRTVVMTALVAQMLPVLAVVVGFIVRNTAGTISFMLFLLFGPLILGGLLPKWIQENVMSYLPGNASDSLVIGHLQESNQYADTLPAAIACVVWFIGSFFVTRLILNKRDV